MKSKSLLSNIKSKDILKQVLLYSYFDIKSVLIIIKYNKSLQKKLDIGIKNYRFFHEIKYSKKFESFDKNGFNTIVSISNIFIKVIMFIFFLIYLILFYAKGSFIDEKIRNNCDKNKIEFIEKMNNYLFRYLIFLFISIVWYILCILKIISFKEIIQIIIFILIYLVDIFYYILLCIKYNYSNHIIFDMILKNKNNKLFGFWSLNFDFIIIIIAPIYYVAIIFFICCMYKCNFYNLYDQIIFTINQIKGINIIKLEIKLDSRFLKDEEINNLLVEYSENFKYELKDYQINYIKEINKIRHEKNIPLLKYNKIEIIPDFLINEPLEIFFYNTLGNFKLNKYLYLIRFKSNEFQNLIKDHEFLSIITNVLLNEIIIIEQYGIQNISIFNSSHFKDIDYSYPIL